MCVLLVAILFLFFAFSRIEPLGERATGVLLAVLSHAISGGVGLHACLVVASEECIYLFISINRIQGTVAYMRPFK